MIRLAIITESATTKSSAKIPFELAINLTKCCRLTVFARSKDYQKGLSSFLKSKEVKLILYNNSLDLFLKLKTAKFNLVSFHSTLFPMLACKLTGIPIISTYYGTQLDAYLEKFLPNQKISFLNRIVNYFVNKLIWLNQKLILLMSDQVIAISKFTQKELRKKYHASSELIYLAVDNLNSTDSPSRKKGVEFNILSVSRFTPYKGFHLILKMARKMRDAGFKVRVTIAGSLGNSNYLNYLQEIKQASDRILVNLSSSALAKEYQKSDVYVTYDCYLFFGLPILEAAFFSKPTLVLNSAAAEEMVIHGKTGYIAYSEEEFEKYLKILVKNDQLINRLGKRAKDMALKRFNWQKQAFLYDKLLRRIMKNAK